MTRIRTSLDRLWDAPDDAPMIQQEGVWHSWGEVRELSERIDERLSDSGFGEGRRVGVVLSNRMESIAALIAILRGGRTLITLNPMQPAARLTADVEKSRPAVVLAAQAVWSGDGFRPAVEKVSAGFAVDGQSVEAVAPRPNRNAGDAEGSKVGDVAIEMFTSGTTGTPKRIPLTWRQLEAAMAAVHQHTGKGGPDDRAPLTGRVSLITLSIVHIGGMWGVLQALAEARPFVMLERFTVDGWRAVIREHRPAVAGLPPAAMRGVLDADVPAEELSGLRAITAGTTFVDPDLADEFTERYGIPVLVMYGATEFSGAIAGWTKPLHIEWWSRKRGSVGRAFPGVRLRTVDEHGTVLPEGQSGRLEVCSSQTGTGTDQWVRTSDLAHIDEDGFVYIDGRADDAILRGGFKVQPEMVAKALRAHPAVLDATVYGRDDARLGSVPVAAIETRPYADPVTEEQLKSFCRGELTAYEVPVSIYQFDKLPRSASMKVDRRRLLELVAAADGETADGRTAAMAVEGQR